MSGALLTEPLHLGTQNLCFARHPPGNLVNAAICENLGKFCPDNFQCSNVKFMEISYFQLASN